MWSGDEQQDVRQAICRVHLHMICFISVGEGEDARCNRAHPVSWSGGGGCDSLHGQLRLLLRGVVDHVAGSKPQESVENVKYVFFRERNIGRLDGRDQKAHGLYVLLRLGCGGKRSPW